MSRQITVFVLFHDCRHLNFLYQPAIIHKRFETNSSFHFKWPTAGKVQFLFCTIFVMVLTTFSFREEDWFFSITPYFSSFLMCIAMKLQLFDKMTQLALKGLLFPLTICFYFLMNALPLRIIIILPSFSFWLPLCLYASLRFFW